MNEKNTVLIIWCIGVASLVASALCLGVVGVMILVANDSGGLVWYYKHNLYDIRAVTVFLVQGIYLLSHGIGTVRRKTWGKILTQLLPVSLLLTITVGELTSTSIPFSLFVVFYCIFVVTFVSRPSVERLFK